MQINTVKEKLIENLEKIEAKKVQEELLKSLNDGQFLVYLQPKFDTQTQEVVGAEALIRKRYKDEILLPSKFIPVYENHKVITILDMYVLEKVCSLQRKWKNEGYKQIPISINESRHHLKNPNHLNELQQIVNKYDANPNLIELELTETTVVDNFEIAKQAEKNVHKLGFVVSMDDFGTGYSSFNVLKNIEIDVLKIDKLFFDDIIQNNRAQIIIESIISMCKRLNIKTVAEGIETKEQLDYLKSIKCDMVQGYYLAKPMSVEEFEKKWLGC